MTTWYNLEKKGNTKFPRNQYSSVCFIHATETVILPPLYETIISAKLGLDTKELDDGIIEPWVELAERYKIIGASELVRLSEGNTVPMRLLKSK